MNHLAHALLAGPGGTEFALGSALGDFTHGHPDATWTAARQAGLRFHRGIDHFTDAHPDVVAARNLFSPPLRRYAGIILDIWFDHLLVRNWPRYVAEPSLAEFSRQWLALLDAHASELPEALGTFMRWMHAHALPVAYGDDATLDVVFHALAHRLSHPSPIAEALPALRQHSAALQTRFDRFFPDLVSHAAALRRALLAEADAD